jgi:hypothetical protein
LYRESWVSHPSAAQIRAVPKLRTSGSEFGLRRVPCLSAGHAWSVSVGRASETLPRLPPPGPACNNDSSARHAERPPGGHRRGESNWPACSPLLGRSWRVAATATRRLSGSRRPGGGCGSRGSGRCGPSAGSWPPINGRSSATRMRPRCRSGSAIRIGRPMPASMLAGRGSYGSWPFGSSGNGKRRPRPSEDQPATTPERSVLAWVVGEAGSPVAVVSSPARGRPPAGPA